MTAVIAGATGQPVAESGDGGPLRPLSTGQEALWLLHRLAPASVAYTVAVAVRIWQRVDAEALSRAVAATLRRHELVRCGVTEIDGRPMLIHAEELVSALELHDVPHADEAEMSALAQQIVALPFDLSRPPLIRFALLRRTDDAVLLVTAHHLVTDAASQVLLLDDLLAAYRAELAGAEVNWPPLKRPYADYVDAELAVLESPRRSELIGYWQRRCSGAPPALELFTDQPRPARKRYVGATVQFQLSAEMVAGIRPAAARLGITPFVLLFSAFQALLHRHSNQEDFLVGYAVTTRPDRTMRNTVGYFVNTLPCRTRLDGNSTFQELLTDTAEQLQGGLAHRDCPLPLLPPALGLPSDPSRTPLVQTIFSLIAATRFQPLLTVLAGAPDQPSEHLLHGLRISTFDVAQQEGQFDLSAELIQTDSAIKVAFKYDTDLFHRTTVERMASHYQRLLSAVISDPTLNPASVSLIDATEREKVLAFSRSNTW